MTSSTTRFLEVQKRKTIGDWIQCRRRSTFVERSVGSPDTYLRKRTLYFEGLLSSISCRSLGKIASLASAVH
jgi:hypothetical protein